MGRGNTYLHLPFLISLATLPPINAATGDTAALRCRQYRYRHHHPCHCKHLRVSATLSHGFGCSGSGPHAFHLRYGAHARAHAQHKLPTVLRGAV